MGPRPSVMSSHNSSGLRHIVDHRRKSSILNSLPISFSGGKKMREKNDFPRDTIHAIVSTNSGNTNSTAKIGLQNKKKDTFRSNTLG